MNSLKWISFATALLATMCACAIPKDRTSSKQSDQETIVLPVRTPFWLDDQELAKAKELALVGDLPASFCIARHYSYAARLDDPDRQFWVLIAAENGDSGAMMMISQDYRTGKDARARSRAEFWRLRAEATRSQVNVDCHRSAP
jgi:hypothetical protein